MNIAESIGHVLKNKRQNIFSEFWKDDFKIVLKDLKNDLSRMTVSSGYWFKALRKQGLKVSALELKDSTFDTITIFKVIPNRIKEAFSYFKDDFLAELDIQDDQKQKTIFCLKVMGALSGFTLSVFYGLNRKKSDFNFKGLRLKNAFTQFIVMEIIYKISKIFILRFLGEVEKELTNDKDLKDIRYFKNLMSDHSQLENMEKPDLEPGDKALQIVDNLRNYIMTGKRSL